MSFWKLVWLFPLVIALHNAEEAIWLPAWSRSCDRWRFPWNPKPFRILAAVLTVLAGFLTWMSVRSGNQSVWTYLLVGYAAAAVANAFIPHLWLSLANRRIMPGTWTGIALIAPSLTVLLVLAVRDCVVSVSRAALYFVAVSVVLMGLLQLVYRLNRGAQV